MKLGYKLKDLQIAGRYFGGDVIFYGKETIAETLREQLIDDGESRADCKKIGLWELLEMFDYEVEVVVV